MDSKSAGSTSELSVTGSGPGIALPPSELEEPEVVPTTLRLVAFSISMVLVALPFMSVTFPPATDLPQHLAQIRQLQELLGWLPKTCDVDALRIQWFAPNVLVYAPLLAFVRVFGVVLGGKLCLAFLLVAQSATFHWAAFRRGLRPSSAWLASAFVFADATTWGFLNFLAAVPFFVLFIEHVASPVRSPMRDVAKTAALLVLLYLSHVLLFGIAGLAVVGFGLARRDGRRDWMTRLAPLAPIALGVALYLPSMIARRTDAGFDTGLHYLTPPMSRLSTELLVDLVIGGLTTSIAAVLVVPILAWIGLALFTRSGDLARWPGSPLALAGAALVGTAIVIPDQFLTTILLWQRIAPIGFALLVLGLPPPKLPRISVDAVSLLVAVTCSFATTGSWIYFDQIEMSGIAEALRATSTPRRVLGLSFVHGSAVVRGSPFLQSFAYLNAVHGGIGNFSFAEHGTTIVAYRNRRAVTWTPGLEWYPHRATLADIRQFDVALVAGSPLQHHAFEVATNAWPMTRDGRFRLYSLADADGGAMDTDPSSPNSQWRPESERVEER